MRRNFARLDPESLRSVQTPTGSCRRHDPPAGHHALAQRGPQSAATASSAADTGSGPTASDACGWSTSPYTHWPQLQARSSGVETDVDVVLMHVIGEVGSLPGDEAGTADFAGSSSFSFSHYG